LLPNEASSFTEEVPFDPWQPKYKLETPVKSVASAEKINSSTPEPTEDGVTDAEISSGPASSALADGGLNIVEKTTALTKTPIDFENLKFAPPQKNSFGLISVAQKALFCEKVLGQRG
jgi:hypothetical protein